MMTRIWLAMVLLGLTACSAGGPDDDVSAATNAPTPSLPDLGPAPELANSVWLNTDAPLRLEDLRGKVVGLEMWTFGCINCRNVMPSLKKWHAAYKDQGLVLIGNHYAVAEDNQGGTWRAYHNRYWPTLYLIDKRGHIRYVHIGEGAYDETEKNIQALLAETYP
jgi:thiol-disulfide isomerase/thioredoxin